MFAITRLAGQARGIAARVLLDAGRSVHAARDAGEGGARARQGRDVARAAPGDAEALRRGLVERA